MSTAARYRAAVERRDLDAVGELLAPEIVFHSPVTFHPFIGRDTVRRLLGEVIQVFTGFRFTDELSVQGAHGLVFRAGVSGTDREIEGIDLLRFEHGREDGLIVDFTVMLRPLSALVPFAQQMGERAQAAGLQTTRV
jgi:ketosteroid isomerase-like protein